MHCIYFASYGRQADGSSSGCDDDDSNMDVEEHRSPDSPAAAAVDGGEARLCLGI